MEKENRVFAIDVFLEIHKMDGHRCSVAVWRGGRKVWVGP